MKTYWKSAFLLIMCMVMIVSCSEKTSKFTQVTNDGLIEIAILQMNDVYEIAGVNGGELGHLARVAGYYKTVREKYPQSMLVLAGDFLNPSLINTMKYEGERIMGESMIETLNAMEIDLAAIGNHEFDLNQKDLQKRIDESTFDWISTNLAYTCGDIEIPLYRQTSSGKYFFPTTISKTFTDKDGTELKMGIFSATIGSNPVDYIRYYNVDSCVGLAIDQLQKDNDIVIGLTHLSIDGDIELAKKYTQVPLIMGGHEHDNMRHEIGDVRITKADANAKTVYLHVISYNENTNEINIESELVEMNASVEKDEKINAVVEKWNLILENNITSVVDNPYEVVYHADPPLDAREMTIRHKQCNIGELITKSMIESSMKNSKIGILNSGSIRLDDQISGNVTGVDIFRILPFGGPVYDVKMSGSLLIDVLDFGMSPGRGSYLQYHGIDYKNAQWHFDGRPILSDQSYWVVISSYLMLGYDIPFLKESHEGVLEIDKPESEDDSRNDIRKLIINYLTSL